MKRPSYLRRASLQALMGAVGVVLAAAAVFGPAGELVWGWHKGADWTQSVGGKVLTPMLGPPSTTFEQSLQLREGRGRVVLAWSPSARGPWIAIGLLCLSLMLLVSAALLLVWVRSLQERLLSPVRKLASSASENVIKGDFATRLTADSPETEDLAQAFNLILEEVEERDRRLAASLESQEQDAEAHTQELAHVNSKLTRSRRMAKQALEAKSAFLANMSHEIRTPMNAVVGMAALLVETDLDEDQRSMADKVVRSSAGLLSILNDILDFSKIEAGKLELEEVVFKPRDVVEDVCDLVAHAAFDKGLKVGCFVHSEVPTTILGDPSRLKQIILNFAGNAVKFTERGVVVIELLLERSINGGCELRVEVRDTGIGIPQDRHADLFESFSQAESSTSRRYGGTGLGLAIAQQLAGLMRGAVGVQSEVGEGSTFWARFWLRNVVGSGASSKALAPNLRGLRALIIEESAEIADVCSRELKSMGCDAQAETSTYAAFEALSRGETYDILLLDSQLPGREAFFGALESHAELADLPVVMLVPGFQAEELTEQEESIVFATLRRPIKREVLASLLERATGLRASEPEPELPAPALEVDVISEGHRSQTRILLVEDNQTNQQLVQYILGKRGYPVDVVDNGIKAVEAYGSGDYDLILMDCQMPEMDGFEATRQIRCLEEADGGHIPILAMTANAMRGDRERCLQAGMDDYITKPIQPRDMLAWMEQWLVRFSAQDLSLDLDTSSCSGQPKQGQRSGFAAPVAEGGPAKAAQAEPLVAAPLPAAGPAAGPAVGPAVGKSSQGPAVDPMILGCLRDGDPVGEELALELIQVYIATAPDSMAEIERLASGGDWEACASAAHKFVSSNGTVGAMEFAQLLRRTESACREGRHADVLALAAEGRQELERAMQELRAMD